MTSFRQREDAVLLKQPDLVIPDLDAPRSCTLIDIKVYGPAASSNAGSTSESLFY